jgi:type II secretory pathway pseudopilin PulG
MVINHKKHLSCSLQQGFMILEALVVITVLMSLMSLGVRSITKNAENTVNQVTAQQLQKITQAAQHYVQDHYPSFKNNSNPTLTWKQLVDEGYLSALISDKNHYGQAYRFTVMKEQQQGTVQLLLTTEGGLTINEQSLRQIAARAGSSAGYASVLDPGNIVGTQRSWVLEGTALPPGHLASLTLVNEQEVMDAATFLRRTQIAGHPEYNTMQADLDIEQHLLTIKGKSSSRATLSDSNITLQNPFGKDNTRTLTLDISGTPSLLLKDTYNQFKGANSRLSGTSLVFANSESDGNKLTINNVNTSNINIENKKNGLSTDIRPAEIRLDSQGNGNPSISVKKQSNSATLETDKLSLTRNNINTTIDNSYPAIFLQGSKSVVVLSEEGLFINNQAVATNNFVTAKMHTVGNVNDKWQLQAVADKLNCNDNQGRLFSVGDNSSSLRKKLLMCIWRPNTGKLSYIVVGEGQP